MSPRPHNDDTAHGRRTIGDTLGALAGAAGVLLTFGFVSVASHDSDPSDAPATIAAALIDNKSDAELAAQLGLAAAFLFVVFVARLFGTLRQSGASSWLPSIALLGGGAIIAALLFEIGVVLAQTSTEALHDTPELAVVLVQLSWNSAALYAPGFAALMLGTTATCFRSAVLPSPIKWLGVALLAAMALIVVLLQAPGLATAPGSVWVIAVSLTMAVSKAPGSDRSTSGTADQ